MIEPKDGAFVGRRREMSELSETLDDVLTGEGRIVMLSGEAGIGKTRIAEELAALAMQRGAKVLWGRAHEQQGMPPYWPWVQVIRAHIKFHDAGQLQAEMGAGAADIAYIVPEALDLLPGTEPPAVTEPEEARFRFFDSVTQFFKRASRRQPLVLVLDNLHQADQTSLLLLEFVAREISSDPIFIIGTFRDANLSWEHPLTNSLVELSRESIFRRVVLHNLGQDDVERLIAAAAGVAPSASLVSAVHNQTEGNPLFTTQVIRLLAAEGKLTPEQAQQQRNWSLGLPDEVKGVIGRRLSRLSETCRQMLSLASVIGREFDFHLLRSIAAALDEDSILNALDEALAAHIIQEVPDELERYSFTHAVTQQTLYEEISSSRRARLHARIAESLEGMSEFDVRTHVVEIARHYAPARSIVGTQKMVRYSIMAGEQALAAYAYEDALSHFERAMAGKEGQVTDDETAEILFGLGRAKAATQQQNQVDEAIGYLTRAFDHFCESGNIPRAIAVAEYSVPTWPGRAGMINVVRRALELVPAGTAQAGRLLARLGFQQGRIEGDYQGASETLQQALAIARENRDVSLEVRTLAAEARIAGFHARWKECLEKCEAVLALSSQVNQPVDEVLAHFWAALSLLTMGKGQDAALPHIEASAVLAQKMRHRYTIATYILLRGLTALYVGDWEAAWQHSDAALAVAPQDPRHLLLRSTLELEAGNMEQMESHLQTLANVLNRANRPGSEYSQGVLALARAGYLAGPEYIGPAREMVQVCLSHPQAIEVARIWANAAWGYLAICDGDASIARQQYEALKPCQGTMIHQCAECVDHLLGLLAWTAGATEDAASHFEAALAFCRKAGYRPEYAWTCYDYAALIVGAGFKALVSLSNPPAPTDGREKALSLLDEALAIAAELDMRVLRERAIALKEQSEAAGAPRRVSAGYPDGLTEREIEVLRLIAAGKSNREIAGELFISYNTAINHVKNILSKTGSANRTEAAAYAIEHGLTL